MRAPNAGQFYPAGVDRRPDMFLIFLVSLILIFGLLLAWITRSSPDPAAHSRAILWGLAVLVTVVFSGGAVKVGLQLFGGQ